MCQRICQLYINQVYQKLIPGAKYTFINQLLSIISSIVINELENVLCYCHICIYIVHYQLSNIHNQPFQSLSIIITHFISHYQSFNQLLSSNQKICYAIVISVYCTLSTINYYQSTISIIINYITHFIRHHQSICRSIMQLSYLYML